MMRRALGIGGLLVCLMLAGVISGVAAANMAGRGAVAGAAPIVGLSAPPADTSPTPTTSQSAARTIAMCPCKAGQRLPPLPPFPAWIHATLVGPAPLGGVPNVSGKLILISLAQQQMWAYQDRTLMETSPVTTGMPQLPTPRGWFDVMWKVTDTMFYSPWPVGSPYYYAPVHVNYALLFRSGGFFLHDAPWRHAFGPGTNVPHTNPDGTQETGSLGCVEMPTMAAAWLYYWAPNGTTIDIVG
jgi:hypothetical protein